MLPAVVRQSWCLQNATGDDLKPAGRRQRSEERGRGRERERERKGEEEGGRGRERKGEGGRVRTDGMRTKQSRHI